MTPSSLAEAVRLARAWADDDTCDMCDSMDNGRLCPACQLARALIAAVGEMDRRRAVTATHHTELVDAMRAAIASAKRAKKDRDAAINESVRSGEECLAAQARAERAEAALARIAATFSCEPDDSGDLVEAARLLVVERDKAKEALAEQVAANNRQSSCCDAADCLGAMSERARVVEEIAAFLDGRAAHHDGKLAALPATADGDERGEHGWASSYATGWAGDIRATLGAKEQPPASATAPVSDDELHRRRAHPDYEYTVTTNGRKDGQCPEPNGEGWEPNDIIPCHRYEAGVVIEERWRNWERFDYHEDNHWRRLRRVAEGES